MTAPTPATPTPAARTPATPTPAKLHLSGETVGKPLSLVRLLQSRGRGSARKDIG
ncbi:hypothetical protein CVS47_03249 [Microbacterium lemovicicum]|uniref:Uncharacterized protein n=1 Tax=Microbacterium lemovicicum TaxID=1072463 RepID=A0A3Q9J0P7_9MICO|nr:hypothetical protein CVS47_03249 [Microbacterium lemovicicum]